MKTLKYSVYKKKKLQLDYRKTKNIFNQQINFLTNLVS